MPCYRLVARKWASLGEVDQLTRDRILDANEMLDAADEAELLTREKAEAERANAAGSGRSRRRR